MDTFQDLGPKGITCRPNTLEFSLKELSQNTGNILVLGERYLGKTCLLKQIRSGLSSQVSEEKYIFSVFIDLAVDSSFGNFQAEIRNIFGKIPPAYPDLGGKYDRLRKETDIRVFLDNVVALLMLPEKNAQLIVVIDHFSTTALEYPWFSQLLKKGQAHQGLMRFVIASEKQRFKLFDYIDKSKTIEIILGTLTANEDEAFVRGLLKFKNTTKDLTRKEEVIEEILRQTAGHPFLIESLANYWQTNMGLRSNVNNWQKEILVSKWPRVVRELDAVLHAPQHIKGQIREWTEPLHTNSNILISNAKDKHLSDVLVRHGVAREVVSKQEVLEMPSRLLYRLLKTWARGDDSIEETARKSLMIDTVSGSRAALLSAVFLCFVVWLDLIYQDFSVESGVVNSILRWRVTFLLPLFPLCLYWIKTYQFRHKRSK